MKRNLTYGQKRAAYRRREMAWNITGALVILAAALAYFGLIYYISLH